MINVMSLFSYINVMRWTIIIVTSSVLIILTLAPFFIIKAWKWTEVTFVTLLCLHGRQEALQLSFQFFFSFSFLLIFLDRLGKFFASELCAITCYSCDQDGTCFLGYAGKYFCICYIDCYSRCGWLVLV